MPVKGEASCAPKLVDESVVDHSDLMRCLQRDKQLRAPILFDGCENIVQRDGLRRPETGQATNKDSFRQKGPAAHYDFHFVPIFTVQNQLQLAGSEETCVRDRKPKQSEVGKRSRQYANTFPNYLLLIISKYSVCTHGENSARCLQRYDNRVLLKDVHGSGGWCKKSLLKSKLDRHTRFTAVKYTV